MDILSNRYLKNTLRIDYKQRLPCFYRYYGAILKIYIFRRFRDCNFRGISQPNVNNKWSNFAYKNNIFGKKEHWLSNWESRE